MSDIIDWELNAAERHSQGFKASVAAGKNASLHAQWLAGSLKDLSTVVQPFPSESYAIAEHYDRILPPSLRNDLVILFDEVRRLNDECVGLRVGEAAELLVDDVSETIRTRLRNLYRRFVDHRLARPNPRDARDPFARFDRIYKELLPSLDEVLNRWPSVHSRLMLDANDYLAWDLYCKTWQSGVSVRRLGDAQLDVRLSVDPRHHRHARAMLELYQWHQADDLQWLTRAVQVPREGTPDDFGACLRTMAADLLAMRPFLIRNFNPVRTVTQVGPRLWAAWAWQIGGNVGQVFLASNERNLLAGIEKSVPPSLVYVRPDGLLAAAITPWIGTLDVEPRQGALIGNWALLSPLYERLLEMYSRIDVSGILARFRAQSAPPPDAEGTALAPSDDSEGDVVLSALAQSQSNDSLSDGPVGPARRVRGVRFSRFARTVEQLGCEIRAGKGSEVLVFRPGYKIARLGHHTRNPEVSPIAIRIALRRLGLSLNDFVSAY